MLRAGGVLPGDADLLRAGGAGVLHAGCDSSDDGAGAGSDNARAG